MVESLLSFGRIEAGAYTWRLAPLDIRVHVHSVVEEFRRDAAALGRAVTLDADDALPPIAADAEALTRAIWNLLDNAAKYSNPGAPVHVKVQQGEDGVRIDVSDSGSGVAPGDERRIFERFVRGTNANNAGARGVGIGLALVKQIVEAHGGSVRVASVAGQGSTFTITLPATASSRPGLLHSQNRNPGLV
jgi:signal transduction histidine kinase